MEFGGVRDILIQDAQHAMEAMGIESKEMMMAEYYGGG